MTIESETVSITSTELVPSDPADTDQGKKLARSYSQESVWGPDSRSGDSRSGDSRSGAEN